jgi:hypothetical protein
MFMSRAVAAIGRLQQTYYPHMYNKLEFINQCEVLHSGGGRIDRFSKIVVWNQIYRVEHGVV